MSQTSSALPLSRKIGLYLGPLLFLVILMMPTTEPLSVEGQRVIAIATWMLTWWISEAVQLPVTALLPIVLLPLLGIVSDIGEATAPYANPIIFLFMGGFMIALALEKWNLHRRMALNIVQFTGTKADGILLGFMLATAFLSMWISNTATAVMMLPIATSMVKILRDSYGKDDKKIANFALVMMLGIAYSANIGGVATIVGTPPNSVLASMILDKYGYEISFADWFMVGLPFSVCLLFLSYIFLVKIIYPNHLGRFEASEEIIKEELSKLGRLKKGEKITLIIFVSIALLWIFRGGVNWLIPGLGLNDTMIAMIGTILLFVLPVDWQKGDFVLHWEDTQKLPWGILLLFGGGISLASSMEKTGLIELIASSVGGEQSLSIFWITALLTIIVLFMTEVMSNVALVTVMIPVVAGLAGSFGENALLMTIPITMAASCAFMLPMATPPNAIVFASGEIEVNQMIKAGIVLNIISVIVIMLIWQFLLPWAFGIELGVMPEWMQNTSKP